MHSATRATIAASTALAALLLGAAGVASAAGLRELERGLDRRERLEIALPGGEIANARRTSLEPRRGGDLLWTGRTGELEEVVLTVAGGRLAGTIFGRDAIYRIVPTASGHRIERDEARERAICGGARPSGPTDEGAEHQSRMKSSVDGSSNREPIVDLLVVYTDESRATVGSKRNIRAVVQHFVDLTNVSFHNSEVGARVRLAHAAEVVVPPEFATDHGRLLEWLRTSRAITDLRDRHGADLVGLVYENGTSVCGAAAMIYRPGGATLSRAYFVSRRACGADTFAHEVGHLMGADHNPEDANVASGAYLYGRGHYHDGRYRTLMSYLTGCGAGCPSQPYFSNPGVRYDARATGLRNERDNARILDELAPEIERFAAPIEDPSCDLDPGDPDFCLECGPCGAGEGNCGADSECDAGLFCAPASGADFGLEPGVAVCRAVGGCDLAPGDPDYCRLCGPCGYGAGDCDRDRECQAGLLCLDDVGETFGFAPSTDVCAFRENGFCPLALGDPDYCAVCGPCVAGEGGCRSSAECGGLLSCFDGVGAELGFRPDTGVCLQAVPSECPKQPGDPDYCKLCGTCDEGEGDCDTDRECRGELACVDGVGVAFGFDPAIDVCLEILAPPRRLKAKALSPNRVRLKWRERSKDEIGFHVEMSVEGGPFARIASTPANARRLFVEDLRSETTYAFRVQAFDAQGVSAYSNTKIVTTP